jgi:hypothetical protein
MPLPCVIRIVADRDNPAYALPLWPKDQSETCTGTSGERKLRESVQAGNYGPCCMAFTGCFPYLAVEFRSRKLTVEQLQLRLSILADKMVRNPTAFRTKPFLKLGVPPEFVFHYGLQPSFPSNSSCPINGQKKCFRHIEASDRANFLPLRWGNYSSFAF